MSPPAFVSTIPLSVRHNASAISIRPVARRAQPVRRAQPARHIVATAAPVEVDSDSFETEVLQSKIPVLVDFYAAWCGPCKLVAPLMEWAAIKFEGQLKVVKIDTENSDKFVKEYGIHGLPTFAVFRDGEAFGVQEGAIGKVGLTKYISKHVPELASIE